MFKTVHDAVVFIKKSRAGQDFTEFEIVVAPPFTALHAVAEAARHTNIGASPARTCIGRRKGRSPAK